MSTTPAQPAPSPPVVKKEVFATFCSGVDQASAQKIMQAISYASQNACTHFHLLFQSCGGVVNDGICLHNFFKAVPMELTLYNVGAVQSIGTIAYLGAKNRVVQKNAVFMVHRTTGPALGVGTERLKSFTKSVELDDTRTEKILREYCHVTADQWSKLRDNEFWFTADDAVKSGLATIGEFSPPSGGPVYNL